MSEMVDRVSRAIQEAEKLRIGVASADTNYIPIMYRNMAIAAIKEMAEPTKAMVEYADGLPFASTKGRWIAMIAEALRDTGKEEK
jgi:hypothetical protein